MTRILVIPDSLECDWRKHIRNEKIFDHIVFMGNYFDTSKHNIDDCISNTKELSSHVDLDKIEFLLGKYDIQYMSDDTYKTDYYNEKYCNTIRDILNKMDVQVSTYISVMNITYLFSNSGFSRLWCNRHSDIIDLSRSGLINPVEQDNYFYKVFSEIGYDDNGESIIGSPVTCNIYDVIDYPINCYTQVVCNDIGIVNDKFICINKPYIIDNNGVISYDDWVERIKEHRDRRIKN